MLRVISRHEERGLGLPYPVVLLNAAEEVMNDQGERVGVRIPDLEGLAAAVAVVRCLHPLQLSGQEVRFIRRVLGFTQKELADSLEVSAPETISRWENGAYSGGYTEKLLRTITLIKLKARTPGVSAHHDVIVGLRLIKRDAAHLPEMLAERVPVTDGARQAWDLPMAA